MQKRIKIEFNAQSKAVVESVVIEYIGEEKELSEKFNNDEILKGHNGRSLEVY